MSRRTEGCVTKALRGESGWEIGISFSRKTTKWDACSGRRSGGSWVTAAEVDDKVIK